MSAKAKKSSAESSDFTYKVGDRVRIRSMKEMTAEFGYNLSDCAFCHGMEHMCGRTATVMSVGRCGVSLGDFNDTSGDTNWAWCFGCIRPVKMTKAQRAAQAKAQAERERAERAEKRRQLAAARKRKAELAKLPKKARDVVALLDADAATFGCQRRSVIALVSAIIGYDLSKVAK